MNDNEIMLFNEELMAKINKRKVQPLEDLKDIKLLKHICINCKFEFPLINNLYCRNCKNYNKFKPKNKVKNKEKENE